MKKAFVIGSLLVVLTLSLGGAVASKGTDTGATYEQLRLFTEVLSIVQSQYVDEVAAKELIYSAIKGTLRGLDPGANPPARIERLLERERGDPGMLLPKRQPVPHARQSETAADTSHERLFETTDALFQRERRVRHEGIRLVDPRAEDQVARGRRLRVLHDRGLPRERHQRRQDQRVHGCSDQEPGGRAGLRDERPPPLLPADHPLRFELSQCLPNRRARYVEVRAHRGLGRQPVPW